MESNPEQEQKRLCGQQAHVHAAALPPPVGPDGAADRCVADGPVRTEAQNDHSRIRSGSGHVAFTTGGCWETRTGATGDTLTRPGRRGRACWEPGLSVTGGNVRWCSRRERPLWLPGNVSVWSPHNPAVPVLGCAQSSGSRRPGPAGTRVLTAAVLATAGTSIGRLTGPVYRRHGVTTRHKDTLRHGEPGKHTEGAEVETGGPVLWVPVTCNAQDRQIRRDHARQRLDEGSLMVLSGGGRCSDWGCGGRTAPRTCSTGVDASHTCERPVVGESPLTSDVTATPAP